MARNMIEFMATAQLLPYLKEIKRGRSSFAFPDWLLEGLQDQGLIDHRNRLTATGEQMLTNHDRSNG